MKIKLNILFLITLFISGCSMQRLAIRSMSGILDNSMIALYEESDLLLAEQAIASDLKLLEGMIKSDPQNKNLLLFACQGFAAYSLGFAEDTNPQRAQKLYLRGRDYGLQILSKKDKFAQSLNKDADSFKRALALLTKEDVPALFWTANNWAGWINLSFTNPQSLADLPRVQMMMARVIELNESYFFGSAHLFFGIIYSVRPPILGGNITKAEYHFNKCFNYADDKFLMPYFYYAKCYATRVFDPELFEQTLTKVISTAEDILIEQRLPNAIAKQKARQLLAQKEEIF